MQDRLDVSSTAMTYRCAVLWMMFQDHLLLLDLLLLLLLLCDNGKADARMIKPNQES
jgi:hypothetical protein